MKNRITEIDLLRFIAAMMVVIFHYAFRGFAPPHMSEFSYPLLKPIAKYGYLGVELFFIISGFVILMSASSGSLRKFAISRFVRLYPAFWVACTITFIVVILFGGDHFSATLPQYLANMTMLSGFIGVESIDTAYWSLFIEIKFYILIAAILLFKQIKHIEKFLFVWLLISFLTEVLPTLHLLNTTQLTILKKSGYLLITEYSGYFIAGATMFKIWKDGQPLSHKTTIYRLSIIFATLALVLHQAYESSKQYKGNFGEEINPLIICIIICTFYLVMLLVTLRKTGWFAKHNWTTIGALTYPLYLIHQHIGYIIFNHLTTNSGPRITNITSGISDSSSNITTGISDAHNHLISNPGNEQYLINEHLIFWGTIILSITAAYIINKQIEQRYAPKLNTLLDKISTNLNKTTIH